MFSALRSTIANGIDPLDLARIVVDPIRRNDHWIIPFPEFRPIIERYNERVIAAFRQHENHPDSAPPGPWHGLPGILRALLALRSFSGSSARHHRISGIARLEQRCLQLLDGKTGERGERRGQIAVDLVLTIPER